MISGKQIQFLGGVYNVANLAARNALPADLCTVGMLVNVLDDGTGQQVLFQLQALPASTSSNWAPYGFDVTLAYFGSGFDGSLAPGFGNVVLTRDTYYQDIQPKTDGTDTIDMATFNMYVRGTLFVKGCPSGIIFSTAGAGGNGAAAGTAGAAAAANFAANHSLGGGAQGTIGGAGGTAAGSQGGAPPGLGNSAGGTGSGINSGAGGSGSGGTNAGGIARNGAAATRVAGSILGGPSPPFAMWYAAQDGNPNFAPHFITGGQCGCGGGGGGGDGTAGGGGGGGGTGGASARLFARTIDRDGTTGVGVIRANGGKGGNGGTPAAGNRGGGGGASGAAGGALQVVAGSLTGSTATNALAADGGDGGDGGNGTGTGVGGAGGDGGRAGQVALYVYQTRTYNVAGPDTAGTTGGAASGNTGGTHGTGGQARVNL